MKIAMTPIYKTNQCRRFSLLLCISLSMTSLLQRRSHAQEKTPLGNEQEVFDDKRGDISIDQETLDKAETAFFEGLTAYRAKKYKEAARLFKAAHKLVPYRDLLFNIARAYESLNDRGSAIKYYKEYLTTKPIDETQVIHRMRELGVSQFDEPSQSQSLNLSAPKVPSSQSKEVDYISWGVIGSGIALLSVGSYFGISALDQAEQAREATQQSRYNRAKSNAESDALIADIGISLGGIAIAGGLYLMLTHATDSTVQRTAVETGSNSSPHHLKWTVLYTSTLNGVGLSGSF